MSFYCEQQNIKLTMVYTKMKIIRILYSADNEMAPS